MDNATCDQMTGDCSCNSGYEFNGDETECLDIDECALALDNCDDNAECTNTAGSYYCSCIDPYFDFNGDGTDCRCM